MNQQLTIPIGIFGGDIITEITCEQFVRLFMAKFPDLFQKIAETIALKSSMSDLEEIRNCDIGQKPNIQPVNSNIKL